jgi:hypothetical protein
MLAEIIGKRQAIKTTKAYWDLSIPVSVEKIVASSLEFSSPPFSGIDVVFKVVPAVELRDLSVRVRERHPSGVEVAVNEDDTKSRQNFAKAYGLGCALLGHVNKDTPMLMSSTFRQGRSDEEDAVLAFAMELLIPSSSLSELTSKYPEVQDLAEYLQVPLLSLQVKLKEEGYL